MDNDNPEMKRYLTELCTRTQGDTGALISMFDVGAAIGLEKAEAGAVAEELIIEGLAELRSLSGGISITTQGVEMVQGKGDGSIRKDGGLQLGSGQVLGDAGRQAVENIIEDIRGALVPGRATLGQLEEIVVDIKTIETQMLSPVPKTAVIREVLRSVLKTLNGLDLKDLAAVVNAMIAS
jgi:hypothetical protein